MSHDKILEAKREAFKYSSGSVFVRILWLIYLMSDFDGNCVDEIQCLKVKKNKKTTRCYKLPLVLILIAGNVCVMVNF